MRIKHISIKNFRGIKQADLTFPDEQRLICLIGPGDSTKSTVLTAIHYALWPSWNLSVSSSDFYECNTDEQICIEVTGVADGYGVSIDGELNNKVSLKTKNVLSTIELFEGSKPFNQRGYGSKKLINLGLQIGDKAKESILLIDEIEPVLESLRWFERSEDFKIYRKELFYRIGKIYAHMVEEKTSLYEAVEALSSQRYFSEKRFNFPRLSSRTVLTKGLEFDCVIIDARDKMDVRDFYVAMTRAKKHIYIISDAKQLSFSGVQY